MTRSFHIALLLCLPLSVLASEPNTDQVPRLIAALDNANVRQGASIALAKLGAAAVPALRESLASDNPDVRVWSAYTLGQIGQAAKPAVAELTKATTDSDPALRTAAAQALGKIGDPAGVDALTAALGDEDDRVRLNAAVALGEIGPPAQGATAKLIAALADQHVRSAARNALIQIGPATVDRLVKALDDDSVRFDVTVVLQDVAPEKAKQLGLDKPTADDLPSLRAVLFDLSREPEEHATAATSLAAMKEDGFRVLVAAFEQPEIASTAATAFSQADSSAVPRLVEALKHDRPEVRLAVADALGHIGPDAGDAAPELTRLLKDDNRDVRYHAVRALHELGQKAQSAVSALREVILDSRELEPTRQWAIKTLVVTLPNTHDAVVKALIEASQEDANYGVRQLARQMLRQVDAEAADAAGIR